MTWIDIVYCSVLWLLGSWKLWELLVIFGKWVERRLFRKDENLKKYRETHRVYHCGGVSFHGKRGDKCPYCEDSLK